MKSKLFKHIKSGNVYTYLGIVRHKDEVTREWERHVLYMGEVQGDFYSRTLEDFDNNFEEVKL